MFREGMYDMCLVVVVLMYGCRSAFLPMICTGGKASKEDFRGVCDYVCVCVCVCVCVIVVVSACNVCVGVLDENGKRKQKRYAVPLHCMYISYSL